MPETTRSRGSVLLTALLVAIASLPFLLATLLGFFASA